MDLQFLLPFVMVFLFLFFICIFFISCNKSKLNRNLWTIFLKIIYFFPFNKLVCFLFYIKLAVLALFLLNYIKAFSCSLQINLHHSKIRTLNPILKEYLSEWISGLLSVSYPLSFSENKAVYFFFFCPLQFEGYLQTAVCNYHYYLSNQFDKISCTVHNLA